jgi:hypothetical protein
MAITRALRSAFDLDSEATDGIVSQRDSGRQYFGACRLHPSTVKADNTNPHISRSLSVISASQTRDDARAGCFWRAPTANLALACASPCPDAKALLCDAWSSKTARHDMA